MSLPEHEETVIECPSVELDEFHKSDFPQLVVNLTIKTKGSPFNGLPRL